MISSHRRLAAAVAALALLGPPTQGWAIDAQQTTGEAASSTGGQAAGQQQPVASQLGTDCPTSTTAGVAGGSAQARAEADAAAGPGTAHAAGPCPPTTTAPKP